MKNPLSKIQLLEFDSDKLSQLAEAKIKLKVHEKRTQLSVNDCAEYKDNVLTVDSSKIDPDDPDINALAFYHNDILFCVPIDPNKILEFLVINQAINDNYDVWVTKTQFELLTGLKINII